MRRGWGLSLGGAHPLVTEHLTAEEYTHDWSNLTGWTVNAVQVNSNRLYGISGGNPAAAGRPFAVAPGETIRLTCEVAVAATSVGYIFVGVDFGGANDGVNASLPTFAGIGVGSTSKTATSFVGSGFGGGETTGSTSHGSAPTGTYRVTVTVDAENISLVVQNQAGTSEFYRTIPRSSAPNGGAITSIVVWNGATNGTSGNYVKALGARKSLTPFRTKSNAAGVIEGSTPPVIHREVTDGWRIQLPAVLDGTKPAPVVLYFHQSGGTRHTPAADARWTGLRQRLMADGYILLSADDGGNRWGNPASLANYAAILAWVRSRIYCGKTFSLAYSMGGLPMLGSLARRDVFPVSAAALLCPVCDLVAMRPTFTAPIDAAWGSTSDETLEALSAGYNPMTIDPAAFGGVPYLFNISRPDPTVDPAAHTDLFEPMIAPFATSTTVNTLGTGHGPAAVFDKDVIVPFFNAYR